MPLEPHPFGLEDAQRVSFSEEQYSVLATLCRNARRLEGGENPDALTILIDHLGDNFETNDQLGKYEEFFEDCFPEEILS